MSQPVKREPSPSDSVKDEESRMYGRGPQTLDEINEAFPQRPRNHSRTLPFAVLCTSLFEELIKDPPRGSAARLRGRKQVSSKQHKFNVISRFIRRWREEVGNDIYPAMRLIHPHIDNERPMYGLKEQTIGKLLVKLMRISVTSEDAKSLINWKSPGDQKNTLMAGDFAGRCFEALSKRPLRTMPGDLRVGDVNELLDKLAAASGEAEQLPLFDEFYRSMTPQEMQWLIRIILRQMKIAATERSTFWIWHQEAPDYFNSRSDLRSVCWDLWDPDRRLDDDSKKLSLMKNFKPQLAKFSDSGLTWDKMVYNLGVREDNPEFWMEEKLDGERMQMHMKIDDMGEFHFGFWSRKGTNYTYLYGDSFDDERSAITRHLRNAFVDGVANCILDGEMIAFDPSIGKMVAFGTLKTAANHAQDNPYDESAPRPLFRVFDIVYLNNEDLTKQKLKTRRAFLEGVLKNVPRRFEIHPYQKCSSPLEIEPFLRKIVEDSSEGIMLKNPNSLYQLNERSSQWFKIKPEYMTGFGENLDCVIIGGYYGTGKRGGFLASFLCGLRASKHEVDSGAAGPEKFLSFFKVGGGFKAEDYAEIQRLIPDEKWHDWNPKSARPYVELAGGDRYIEKPDRWVRPSDSIVVEVKAASVEESTSFRVGQTLRFPRFRSIRIDKKWDDALDIDEWHEVRYKIKEEMSQKNEMQMETRKKKRPSKRQKRGLTIAGDAEIVTVEKSKLFEGRAFYIPGRSQILKKTKEQLENLVREHGGTIVHNPARVAEGNAIGLADRENLMVGALLRKDGVEFVVRPKWVLDCIEHQCILPYEECHLFRAPESMCALAAKNTDRYGDSYYRDLNAEEMSRIFARMKEERISNDREFDIVAFYDQLEAQHHELPRSKGYLFRRCRVYFVNVKDSIHALTMARLQSYVRFGNGQVAEDLDDGEVTHVVIVSLGDGAGAKKAAADIMARVSKREALKLPHVATEKWLEVCWEEETLVAEERYAP